ncbi:MAG: glutathione S-transferase family protein [Pseudomonadota bacterium]
MADLKLYFFPRACSGVTMTALAMAGKDYDSELINIFTGAQKSPEYLKVNRNGKVPALMIDGEPVTENAAILMTLAEMFPDAGILPKADTTVERAQQRGDLVWCSAMMHPLARQMRMPIRFTNDDTSLEGVKSLGQTNLKAALQDVEARVADGKWFYGDQPSIIDVYLRWILGVAISAGFPIDEFPAVADLLKRVEALPAYREAKARETQAAEAADIKFPT